MSTTHALLKSPRDELAAPTDEVVSEIAAMSLQEQFGLFKGMPTDKRMRLEAEVLAYEESEDRGYPVSVADLWDEPEFRAAWAISEETNTPLAFNYHRILKDGTEDTREWARAAGGADRAWLLHSRWSAERTIVLRRYGATRSSSHRRTPRRRRATALARAPGRPRRGDDDDLASRAPDRPSRDPARGAGKEGAGCVERDALSDRRGVA